MRPIYETRQNREAEHRVMEGLCRLMTISALERMPKLYHHDYKCNIHGVPTAVEIKCREFRWGQYDTVILSKDKLDRNFTEYMEHDRRFLFVVSCQTGLYGYWLNELNSELLDVRLGGRKDRNDPKDIELVYHIPVELFWDLARGNIYTPQQARGR